MVSKSPMVKNSKAAESGNVSPQLPSARYNHTKVICVLRSMQITV
jgi:hypothetical protein